MKKDLIKHNLFVIPIVTLIIGFIPFCILSITNDVFWIDTKYDVPLIYNISVMIGDSILLPIINFHIAKLFFIDLGNEIIAKYKKILSITFTIAFVFSFISNLFAHWTWKNDFYTDFISLNQQTFLISGYWHLVFSILEMTILFCFPVFWYITIKEAIIPGYSRSRIIWLLILIFTLLAIGDLLMKYFFVYKVAFLTAMKMDYFAFITPAITVLILVFMNVVRKNVVVHR
jgi:hypothetical protein